MLKGPRYKRIVSLAGSVLQFKQLLDKGVKIMRTDGTALKFGARNNLRIVGIANAGQKIDPPLLAFAVTGRG